MLLNSSLEPTKLNKASTITRRELQIVCAVLSIVVGIECLELFAGYYAYKSGFVYVVIGDIEYGYGNQAGALTNYQRAIKLNPRNSEAFTGRGNIQFDRNDLDGALADFQKAIQLNPQDSLAFNGRGNVRKEKGDLDSALIDYQRAINLDPQNFGALNGRGTVKEAKDDLDGALDDYHRALNINPNCSIVYNNCSNVRLRLGDFGGALEDCNKALAIDSHNARALQNRGHVKADKGDLNGAWLDCNEAVVLNPKDGGGLFSRGWLNYDLHAFTNALSDLRAALESGCEYPDYAHYFIWLSRAQLGETDAATKELQTYFDSRKTGRLDDWQAKIGGFLDGQLTEAGLLNAANSADQRKDQEQHCEAYFYTGAKRLLIADKPGARNCFEKCLQTGVCDYIEWPSAKSELKHLRDEK